MRITFERSGGFTGIPMTTTVDTQTLAAAQATEFRNLVEAADFFRLPATIPAAAQPDRFQYQITIEDGDRHHTVSMGESVVPGTLRPLIERMMQVVRQGGSK